MSKKRCDHPFDRIGRESLDTRPQCYECGRFVSYTCWRDVQGWRQDRAAKAAEAKALDVRGVLPVDDGGTK